MSDRARAGTERRRIFPDKEAPHGHRGPDAQLHHGRGSVHTDLAERISHFNWDSDTGPTVTALFPAPWNENAGDLVTLREDGSLVLDTDDAGWDGGTGAHRPLPGVAPVVEERPVILAASRFTFRRT